MRPTRREIAEQNKEVRGGTDPIGKTKNPLVEVKNTKGKGPNGQARIPAPYKKVSPLAQKQKRFQEKGGLGRPFRQDVKKKPGTLASKRELATVGDWCGHTRRPGEGVTAANRIFSKGGENT